VLYTTQNPFLDSKIQRIERLVKHFLKEFGIMANKQENIKVYLYTRVSTAMQVDGYSLDAQKTKMKAFCEFNNY